MEGVLGEGWGDAMATQSAWSILLAKGSGSRQLLGLTGAAQVNKTSKLTSGKTAGPALYIFCTMRRFGTSSRGDAKNPRAASTGSGVGG